MDTNADIVDNRAQGKSRRPWDWRRLFGGRGHDPVKPAENKQHKGAQRKQQQDQSQVQAMIEEFKTKKKGKP